MNPSIKKVEELRRSIQNRLDYNKTKAERNKLGQFATPISLSIELMHYAKEILSPETKICFLDPAFGTGSFYSALLHVFESSRIAEVLGFEIDEQVAGEAKRIWNSMPLKLKNADFTNLKDPDLVQANLILCNPPYIRHHYLTSTQKKRLRDIVEQRIGISLSGLSGLYWYYMLISHNWLSNNGIAGWLVPAEFLDVNYGKAIKQYLLEKVTLLRIHRFDPNNVQFSNANVSSAVVWFKNSPPLKDHFVEFTHGDIHSKPIISKLISVEDLQKISKWSILFKLDYEKYGTSKTNKKLSDLFTIKRGLATGANEFFILEKSKTIYYKIPSKFLIPILPMPRDLTSDEIYADENGNPILERQLYLLSCNLPEEKVKSEYPELWKYLRFGRERGIDKRYLCQHRSPWYSQEQRLAAPFLCSYIGRKTSRREKPFRFILNHSKVTASNSYILLYPKSELREALERHPKLYKKIWNFLKEITTDELVNAGRVYGRGLYKLEPNELANVSIETFLL